MHGSPDDWIVFTGRQGETQTLWKVQLGPGGKTAGKAVRATEDAQGDYGASFAAGKLVFSRTRVDMNFWALPLDPTGEHIAAPPEPLTSTPVRKGQQSAAGAKLLYSAENGDRFSLFLKDGTRTRWRRQEPARCLLLRTRARRLALRLWRRNQGAAQRVHEIAELVVVLVLDTVRELRNAPPILAGRERNCSCGPTRRRSGTSTRSTSRRGQVNRIVSATADLNSPRLSPDGRWISFVAEVGEHRWQAFVASASHEKVLGSSDWVPVTPVSDSFFFAFWSARSDLIYTLSSHEHGGNLRFLDAQRLDTETKRPLGAAMPVYEFDETLVPGMDPIWNTVSVDGNRIILELGGVATDIWIK